MDELEKEKKKVYVQFRFGSCVYIDVALYEGKTLIECLKLRSDDIVGYMENGKYMAI